MTQTKPPTPQISQDTTSAAYDVQGLERCDALFAAPASPQRGPWRTDFDNDALASMDRAILSTRFKEWKPISATTPATTSATPQQKHDRQYCYLFNSNAAVPGPAAQIQDPYLKNMKCSLDDVGRLGNPVFITNIFPDATPDHPHAGRMDYQKCVYEIDPTTVTGSNLNTFWKSLADAECAGYKDQAQLAASQLSTAITQCNQRLSIARQDLAQERSAFANLQSNWTALTDCRTNIASASNDLANIRAAQSNLDCIYYANDRCPADPKTGQEYRINGEQRAAAAALNAATVARSRTMREITDLERIGVALQSQSNALGASLITTREARESCEGVGLPSMQMRVKNLTGELAKVNVQIVGASNALSVNISNVSTLKTSVAKLGALKKDLDAQLAKARAAAQNCRADIERNEILMKTNRDDALNYARMQEQCNTDYIMKLRRLEQMRQTHDTLVRERDEWLARCRNNQQAFYDKVVSKINTETKVVEDRGRQLCAAVDPVANEVRALLTQKQKAMQELETIRSITIDKTWCRDRANGQRWSECCDAA